MCLLNLARLLGMRPSRHVRECHTDVSRRSRKAKAGATPQALPLKDRDPSKETNLAARTSSQSIEALMLSRPHSGRPSNHDGVLTAARDESSLAKARSAACRGSRLSKHRDHLGLPRLIPATCRAEAARRRRKAGPQGGPQGLSRRRAAAAPRHEESCNLSRLARARISGHTAPT
jgi:hypothetical protein